jgi:hypothetical protein
MKEIAIISRAMLPSRKSNCTSERDERNNTKRLKAEKSTTGKREEGR